MIENGLEEEARRLYPFRSSNALKTVGYKEMFDLLDQNISLKDAIKSIQANTRKYARKQITWFRKYDDAVWYEPSDLEDIIYYIENG